jgi:hypothetical protein
LEFKLKIPSVKGGTETEVRRLSEQFTSINKGLEERSKEVTEQSGQFKDSSKVSPERFKDVNKGLILQSIFTREEQEERSIELILQ